MQITDRELWFEFRRFYLSHLSEDDKKAFRFAETFADLTEQDVAKGESVKKSAPDAMQRAAKECNLPILDEPTYYKIVTIAIDEILAVTWTHGEEAKKWWREFRDFSYL